MRILRGGLVLLVVVGFSAGCTVPIGSSLAISRSQDGSLNIVAAVCEGDLDGASVYSDERKGEKVATWKPQVGIQAGDTWSATQEGLGPEWEERLPLALNTLDHATKYHLHGWTTDNDWSATGPSFSTTDLAELGPGELLDDEGELHKIDSKPWAAMVCASWG